MNKRNNKNIVGLSNKFLPLEKAQKYNEHFNTHKMPFFNKPQKTDEGFLIVDVVITEPGVLPYTYRNFDGTEFVQNEFLDSSVYAKEFLNSCEGAPFVLEHPKNSQGALTDVTPENYNTVVMGVVTNPRVDTETGKVLGTLKIWNTDVIHKIETKELEEISSGYKCRVIPEQGNYEGTPYDVRQTNMIMNHLALVEEGRAGDSVKVLYNSKNIKYSNEFENFLRSENNMKKTKEQLEAEKRLKASKENTGTPPPVEAPALPAVVKANPQDLEGSKGVFNQESFMEMMKKLFEMFQGQQAPVMNQSPDVPKKVEGVGAAPPVEQIKKEVLNSFNALITNSVQSQVLQQNQEVSETYAKAQAVLGADVREVASKFNTLDGFRRHVLVDYIKMEKDIVDRLNSIQVKAYYDVHTEQCKKDINQPRLNSYDQYSPDEVVMSISEFANA